MKVSNHLSTARLREVLCDDTCPFPERESKHLEECAACRQQIEDLAADQSWWSLAAESLSSADQLQVSRERQSPWTQEAGGNGPAREPKSTGHDSWHEQGPARPIIGPARQPGPTEDLAIAEAAASALPGMHAADQLVRLLDPPGHPEMLGRIDQYEIESVIGQGGMGVVFKAFDRELHRLVALKFLAPHLAANGVARQRFEREARAAAAVVHPNVVPIYAIQAGPRPYLVMALVAGKSLQNLVESEGPLSTREVVRISVQVAAGMAAAHKQGLIHRDIKPGNILVDGDAGRVLITDFGLARAADDVAMTQTGWLAGTPHYMSPEQARGGELDPRSDLFSLGSAMYFLATGREPFRAEKPLAVLDQICRRPPRPVRNVRPEVDEPLALVIERLMEKRPEDRFDSADDLHKTLEDYLAHLQHPRHHRCPVGISPRQERRQFRIGLGIAATLFSVAIGVSVLHAVARTFRTIPRETTRSSDTVQSWARGLVPIEQYTRDKQALETGIRELSASMAGTSPSEQGAPGFDFALRVLDMELSEWERRSKDWDAAAEGLRPAAESDAP